MDALPVDHFVKAQQFVPTVHRDVYSAIDPTQASLSQKGRVIIITGASQGLGAQVCVPRISTPRQQADRLRLSYHPSLLLVQRPSCSLREALTS
jgi:hypothetical protein